MLSSSLLTTSGSLIRGNVHDILPILFSLLTCQIQQPAQWPCVFACEIPSVRVGNDGWDKHRHFKLCQLPC